MMEGKALTASSRNSDPDFPGVLRIVSERHRVAVNPDGTRYQLQQRIETPQGAVWVPRSYASLSALLKAQASKVEGLVIACKGLPDDPAQAMPDLQERRAALLERFAATDWRRQDYGRAVRQDGNIRLAVDPDATVYRLQWIGQDEFMSGGSDSWVTQFQSPFLSDVADFIRRRVYEAEKGPFGQCKADMAPRVLALLDGFPEHVSEGQWPHLPERPQRA